MERVVGHSFDKKVWQLPSGSSSDHALSNNASWTGKAPIRGEVERIWWPFRYDCRTRRELAVLPTSLFFLKFFAQPLNWVNSDGAQEALEEYFKKIGGRPEKPTKKRKSLADKASSTPDKPTKRGRKPSSIKVGTSDQESSPENTDWAPPTGDWGKELSCISTVLRDPDGDGLVAYLEWKNGRKSRAPIQTCYERCPQMVW